MKLSSLILCTIAGAAAWGSVVFTVTGHPRAAVVATIVFAAAAVVFFLAPTD